MGRHKKESSAKKCKKPPLQTKQLLDELVEDLLQKCTHFSDSHDWQKFLGIYELVEKIRTIEQEYVVPVIEDKRDENMEMFLSWCCNNAAKSSAVKIRRVALGNYGVFAEENIVEGELLFAIPRKLMITTVTAMDSIWGPFIEKDAMLQHMPNVVLALHLMAEACDKSSFWKPYIHILPYTYNTPLYFTPSELKELQSSPVLDECMNVCRSIARQYAYFYKFFQANPEFKKLSVKQHFSYDFYRWAVSTVMTRQNSVPSLDDQSLVSALVPLWDMCNHAEGKFSTDFRPETDDVRCFAMQPFQKGREVHIFYGPRPNSEFFLHSGFVFLENKHDCLPLKLGISKADALYNLKCQLCAKCGIPSINGKYTLRNSIVPVDENLIMFAQIFSLTKDTLPADHLDKNKLLEWLKEDSEINSKALDFLKTRISLIDRSYSTTMEEDEALLQTKLSAPHLLSVQLRFAEKSIFHKAVKYLESLSVS